MAVSLAKDLAKDQDKFVLRLPTGMRDRIKAAADKNNRSMNSEIVATLEEAYPSDNFDFATFMESWMVPILRAETEEERAKLMMEANDFLASHGTKSEVTEVMSPDGSRKVMLRTGGVSFVVGSATELIVADVE